MFGCNLLTGASRAKRLPRNYLEKLLRKRFKNNFHFSAGYFAITLQITSKTVLKNNRKNCPCSDLFCKTQLVLLAVRVAIYHVAWIKDQGLKQVLLVPCVRGPKAETESSEKSHLGISVLVSATLVLNFLVTFSTRLKWLDSCSKLQSSRKSIIHDENTTQKLSPISL